MKDICPEIRNKTMMLKQVLLFVKSEFSKICGVKEIYFTKNEICTLWFFIKPYNASIEDKVFSAEYDLLRKFKGLKFDFLVLPKMETQNIPNDAQRIL